MISNDIYVERVGNVNLETINKQLQERLWLLKLGGDKPYVVGIICPHPLIGIG